MILFQKNYTYNKYDSYLNEEINRDRANKEGKFVPKNRKQLDKLVKDESIHLGDIDVSNITDFSGLFSYSFRKDFSGIEKWDVRNVRDVWRMLKGTKAFNQDLESWSQKNKNIKYPNMLN